MQRAFPQNQDEEIHESPDIQMVNLENLSIEELLAQAQENYEIMNYERSNLFYEEALRREPENEKVLTSYGSFLTNVKETDKAKELLTQAIMLSPDTHPKKYLYIAELFTGADSVTFYLKAIEILTNHGEILEKAGQTNVTENGEEYDLNDIKKDLSQAYTALGELYMTDLALTENAINICKEYLHKAIEIDQTNLDSYLQLTNYYLEVDDHDMAEKSAFSLMDVYKQAKDADKDDFFDEFPETTYLAISKVLIELQKHSDALAVLEDMFEDNSCNLEVLYLMIYCNYMMKHYMTCKELMDDFNAKQEKHCDDQEIIAAKEELEESLKKVDIADGNDWEDVSEEHMSNGDMEVE